MSIDDTVELILGTASDIDQGTPVSMILDGDEIYLQKNTLIKECTLTIGEEYQDDSYYLVVAGTETNPSSALFKKNVDIEGDATVAGLITAESGIVSEGDITADNQTIFAYQFSGENFSGDTMSATTFSGGTYVGDVEGATVSANYLTCSGEVDFSGAGQQTGIRAQFG